MLEGGELPIIDITGLIGCTFITNPDDIGEQTRAKVVGATPTQTTSADGKDLVHKFRCKHGERIFEEVCTCNKMLEWCDRDLDKDDMYQIDKITRHRKAILPDTSGAWEVLVHWASGETSWEPLSTIFNDDPVTITVYASRNHLLAQIQVVCQEH